ncbi:MAG: apolipoprotein N-acyltransferase [Epsilonproteobacteria bacterium]|nr:apolipoprotein N-acyltransferase [Campylobacterota bacterium]
MNKIRQYFTTFVLIRGFFIALLGSAFIYLNYFDFSVAWMNTLLGIASLYLLLQSETKIWFISGAFFGLFWFWWIALSLIHYDMVWAAPIEILIIMLTYGILFAFISWLSEKIAYSFVGVSAPRPTLLSLVLKAVGLLALSYIHPFSFDWFKPELMFVESYVGIEKWQFGIVLVGIVLTLWQRKRYYLLCILFAYTPLPTHTPQIPKDIALVTTHTSVHDKWNKALHQAQFDALFKQIDEAITNKKKLVILPESVFPIFLNRDQMLLTKLQERAKHISIITGGLYWDGKTPRNSTYIFTNGQVSIANKVLLVPFGEANPLPDFLSDWVNEVFYDGAVDYKASDKVIDYKIDGITYRNAICFEATSEKLYEKDKEGHHPKNMIVLSNNGWFHPSIESSLQKLLLEYYSKKYGTTIYHAINMSGSYVIHKGITFTP